METKKSKVLLYEFYQRLKIPQPKFKMTGTGMPYDPWTCEITIPTMQVGDNIFETKNFTGKAGTKKVAENNAADVAVAYLKSLGFNLTASKNPKYKFFKNKSNQRRLFAYRNNINEQRNQGNETASLIMPDCITPKSTPFDIEDKFFYQKDNDFELMSGLPNLTLNIPNEYLSGTKPEQQQLNPTPINENMVEYTHLNEGIPNEIQQQQQQQSDHDQLQEPKLQPVPVTPIDNAINNMDSIELNRLLLMARPGDVDITELLANPKVLYMLSSDIDLANTFMTFQVTPQQQQKMTTLDIMSNKNSDVYNLLENKVYDYPMEITTQFPGYTNSSYMNPVQINKPISFDYYSGINQYPMRYFNNYYESNDYKRKNNAFRRKKRNMPRYKISGGIGIFKKNAANKKTKKNTTQTHIKQEPIETDDKGNPVKMEIDPVESKPTILHNAEWSENTEITNSIYSKLKDHYPNSSNAVIISEELKIPHNDVIQTFYKVLEPRGLAEKFPGIPPYWKAIIEKYKNY